MLLSKLFGECQDLYEWGFSQVCQEKESRSLNSWQFNLSNSTLFTLTQLKTKYFPHRVSRININWGITDSNYLWAQYSLQRLCKVLSLHSLTERGWDEVRRGELEIKPLQVSTHTTSSLSGKFYLLCYYLKTVVQTPHAWQTCWMRMVVWGFRYQGQIRQ